MRNQFRWTENLYFLLPILNSLKKKKDHHIVKKLNLLKVSKKNVPEYEYLFIFLDTKDNYFCTLK